MQNTLKVIKVPSDYRSAFNNQFECVDVFYKVLDSLVPSKETKETKETVTTIAIDSFNKGVISAQQLANQFVVKCPLCNHVARTAQEAEYITEGFCAVCEDAKVDYAEEMKADFESEVL